MPTRVGLGGLGAVAVTYGFARYGYGLFVPVLREQFGLSTPMLGVLASASYAAYLAMLVGSGVAAARTGPRVPVVIGSLSAAAGMAIIAVAQSWPVLALGVVVAGSSAGWSWAPFSDAVARMVDDDSQARTLSVISTGTTFGLATAAPIAMLAGASWRPAWWAFAATALATAAYNTWLLPTGPPTHDGSLPRLRVAWFVCPRSGPLLAFAFAFMLAGTVYLTFAVDLVRAGGLTGSAGPVLWLVIGVAGLAGIAGGDLITRYGLMPTHRVTVLTLAASIAALAVAPGSWSVLIVSAALFGAGYMIAGALLSVWSSRVFADRPAVGFTATILTGSLGSIAGPAAAGAMATRLGMAGTFLVLGVATALSVIIRPAATDRRDRQRSSTTLCPSAPEHTGT